MPFTPTHILAIVPIAAIKRLSLPFSALVIGSMIPDFPLFVSLSPKYDTTHSPLGLFTACLPLGLASFLMYHLLMRRPLVELLPFAIRSRLPRDARIVEPSLSFFARASLAIVVGASTHVFWDSFTHRDRWGTRIFPRLNDTVMNLGDYAVPGYKLLQYGCTFIGLPCLLLLAVSWLSNRRPDVSAGDAILSGTAKAAVYLLAALVPIAVALLVWRRSELSLYERLGRSVTMSGLALMAVILSYCLVFQAVGRRSTMRIRGNRSGL